MTAGARAAAPVGVCAGSVLVAGLLAGCATRPQRPAATEGATVQVAACASPAPSDATPSPSSSPATVDGQYSPAIIAAQDRLLAVAGPFVDLADPDESRDRSRLDPVAEAGLAGIAIDVPTSTLHLAWKGPVPTDVQRILRAAPRTVHVDLRRAPYSLVELHSGQQAVADADPRLRQRLGVAVETVDAGTAGEGLDVAYRPTTAAADPGAAAVLAALRPLVHVPLLRAECTTGVDVTDGLRG